MLLMFLHSHRSRLLLLLLLCFGALGRGSNSVLPATQNNQFLGVGTDFSAILQKDGTVWTVGYNRWGQLGDGYTGGWVTVPVKVVNLTNIAAISVGNQCGIALKSDGTVWAWGYSTAGQLGQAGTNGTSNVGVQVLGLPPIRSISCGGGHCLALDANGQVWAWGANSNGQLGPAAASNSISYTPVQVTGLSNIIAVAAGATHSLALTASGTVYGWGDNSVGELGHSGASTATPTLVPGLAHIIQISANTQSLALTSGGIPYLWGSSGGVNYGSTPYQAPLTHIKTLSAEGSNSAAIDSAGNLYLLTSSGLTESSLPAVTATAGSGQQTLAVTQGIVEAWGNDQYGQLGIGKVLSKCSLPMDSLLGDTMGISQVATGLGVTYSLYRDGTVHAVGRNDVGQLGNGTTGAATSTDAPIPGLTGIVEIAAGAKFGVALRVDGAIFTWGCNDYGQLGNGTTIDSDVPIQVPGVAHVFAIAAGSNHVMAQADVFYTWGRNNHGQLGLGTAVQQNSPQVATVKYNSYPLVVSQIVAAGDHSMLMGVDNYGRNSVWAWGDNTYGQIGNGTTTDVLSPTRVPTIVNPLDMAAGSNHSLAYDLSTGKFYAWGDNEDGELGDGGTTAHSSPEQISVPTQVTEMFAGNHTSYFLDPYNNLLAWGLNTSGQLGQGSNTNVSTPQYSFTNAITLSSFADHMVVLAVDPVTAGDFGTVVVGSGDNSQGELDALGQTSTTFPIQSSFQNNYTDAFVALSGGQKHSLALDFAGALSAWGDNSHGQLGDGTTNAQLSPEENSQGLLFNRISAGTSHSAAIDQTGKLYTWGDNTYGQLGLGSTAASTAPAATSLTGVKEVSAGFTHTLVLKDNGTVWSTGDNSNGELGDGTTTQRLSPVQVSGLTGIKAIAAGTGFSLALKDDGSVWGWGTGSSNQLGSGANSSVPVQISGLTSVVSITAGGAHGMAAEATGGVFAWGANDSGQLGIGTFSSTAPVSQISDSHGTSIVGVSVAAGADFSAVLRPDGSVVESGDDSANQLDDNAYVNKSTPQPVLNVPSLGIIATGSAHVLSQKSDGTVEGAVLLAWGDDSFGQLGNGQSYPPPPATPGNLLGILNGSNVSFTWTYGGTPGLIFEIDGSTDGGSTWPLSMDVIGPATSYTSTGLTYGATYVFRIKAFNTGGASQPSPSTQPLTIPYPIPPTPGTFTAVPNGPGEIDVAWTWTNIDPVLDFQIQVSTDQGITWSNLDDEPATTRSYKYTGLSANASYQFRVAADGQYGQSAMSAAASATTIPPPSAPSGLNSSVNVSGGNATVTLQWTEQDSTASGYEIDASIDGGTTWTVMATTTGGSGAQTYTTPMLLPGTVYTLSVTALNSAHQASAPTQIGIARTPYTTPASPSGVQFTMVSPGVYTFTWADTNGNDETGIQVQTSLGGATTAVATLPAGTTSYTVSGTTANPATFQFTATNPSYSASSSTYGPPIASSASRYAALVLPSSFIPYYVSNNGVITGTDSAHNLARWTGSAITELTANGSPVNFPPLYSNNPYYLTGPLPKYSAILAPPVDVNNAGAVVSSFGTALPGIDQNSFSGVYWSGSQFSGTIKAPPDTTFTTHDPNSTVSPPTCEIYSLIDDDGKIYGYQTVNWLGVDPSSGTPLLATPGSEYVYPNYYGPFNFNNLGFVDGFLFPISELGTAQTLTNTGAAVFPVLAAQGVVVTCTSTTSGNGGSVSYKVGSQTLPFGPITANNLGMVFGNSSSGISVWTSASGASTIWPVPGDEIAGVATQHLANSRVSGNNSPDYQVLGGFSGLNQGLLEQVRYANGSPSGVWAPTSLQTLLGDGPVPLTGFTPTGINDNGVISGSFSTAQAPLYAGGILVPAELGVDANNDGTIVLANEAHNPENVDTSGNPLPMDATSAAKPFRFWINNDHDTVGANPLFPTVQDDADPSANPPDSASGLISCTRDLEDYSLLCIYVRQFSAEIQNGDIQVGLEIVPTAGAPSINVFDSFEQDGQTSFRSNADMAGVEQTDSNGNPLKQIGATVDATHPLLIPSSYFQASTGYPGLAETNPKKYLLFEAVGSGTGQLRMTFSDRSGNLLGVSASVCFDFEDIKNMYERWTVGDVYGTAPTQTATLSTRSVTSGFNRPFPFQYTKQSPENPQYIVFVHGWNLSPWERDACAETAYKRLHWLGYNGRFAAFQWPTDFGFDPLTNKYQTLTDREDYDNGEFAAWRSAPGLAALLIGLNNHFPGAVNVFAHSMGNVTTGEALRLVGESNVKISNYVACQAAVEAEAYDPTTATSFPLTFFYANPLLEYGAQYIPLPYGPSTPDIYSNWLASNNSGVMKKYSFYNENDFALSAPVWEWDQITKPDNTGSDSVWGWAGNNYLTDAPDQFYRSTLLSEVAVSLSLGTPTAPADRYEIMSYAAEPRSRALGRTPGPGATVTNPVPAAEVAGFTASVNLERIWPADANDHRGREWHSAEFMFTTDQQDPFWKQLINWFGISTSYKNEN